MKVLLRMRYNSEDFEFSFEHLYDTWIFDRMNDKISKMYVYISHELIFLHLNSIQVIPSDLCLKNTRKIVFHSQRHITLMESQADKKFCIQGFRILKNLQSLKVRIPVEPLNCSDFTTDRTRNAAIFASQARTSSNKVIVDNFL